VIMKCKICTKTINKIYVQKTKMDVFLVFKIKTKKDEEQRKKVKDI
jgi:hypothetical protein